MFFLMAVARHTVDLLNTFFIYYVGPIVTFDRYMLEFNSYTSGWHTFYPFAKLLSIIGFQLEPLEPGPYIPPGQPNVFTMMAGPYVDYGVIGLVIVPFFLGLIYSIIYTYVRRGNIYFITFYSLFTYPLALSFFAYQYSLASWLYYIIILFVIKCMELFPKTRRIQ